MIPGFGFYKGNVPVSERARLISSEYPGKVTLGLLEHCQLRDAYFADFGCGANSDLAKEVCLRGGRYLGFDIDPDAIKELEGLFFNINNKDFAQASCHQMDIGDLHSKGFLFDYSHVRLVLGHVPEKQLGSVIEAVCKSTRHTAFFMELNWGTLGFVAGQPDFFKSFIAEASVLFRQFGYDSALGAKLLWSVRAAMPAGATAIELINQRPVGTYTQEIVGVALTLADYSQELADTDVSRRFAEYAERLRSTPVLFRPPALVAVTVKMPGP